jgi:hypothetical protein
MQRPVHASTPKRRTVSAVTRIAPLLLACCATASCRPNLLLPPERPALDHPVDLRTVVLHVASFKVDPDLDPAPEAEQDLRVRFLDYVRARTRFGGIDGARPQQCTPSVDMSVVVRPSMTRRRTWVLDLPFFYPCPGYWWLTPSWGDASVVTEVELRDAAGGVIDKFSVEKNAPYSAVYYSWYRPGPVEDALRESYEDAFLEVGQRIAGSAPKIAAAAARLANGCGTAPAPAVQ